MTYIDAYLLPVPKDRVDDYKQLAREVAGFWQEHGAIGYVESLADDVPHGELTSFPRAVMVKENETVILSWIIYPSKEVRDAASKAMMADKRMTDVMNRMPTDGERMIFGGFEAFIEHRG